MKAVLITGVAGTGKSTLCGVLIQQGYEAHDLEKVEELFNMYRKDNGELYTDFDNSPEKIANSIWRCDPIMLKQLISEQKTDVAFYAGAATNMDDILSLFDKVINLVVTPAELHKRLMSREGKEDIGNTEESRQAVLGWQAWWDEEMADKGAVAVPADVSPEDILKLVLKVVS